MTVPWVDEDGDERWGEPWDEPGWPEDAYLCAEYGLFKRDADNDLFNRGVA